MKIYYNTDTCAVELSARTLCELSLDVGNLDTYRRSCLDSIESSALQGRGRTLINTSLYGSLYFTVNAYASSFSHTNGKPIVELRCNFKKRVGASFMPDPWTFGYLKILAYFAAVECESDTAVARLIGVLNNKDFVAFECVLRVDELRIFYIGLLAKTEPFAQLAIKKSVEIYPKLKNIKFPYPQLREGQELMIKQTYSSIKRSALLFVQAPTGTGKTISSIYPAVKAVGDGYIDRIFYLTAKSSTKREAFGAAGKLFRTGARLKTIALNSKEQMCVRALRRADKCTCFDCDYAVGYYERSRQALVELLNMANGYPASLVADVAKKYKVCPYELSLDLSEYCEIIICDYNYAFDAGVYLRRYFNDEHGSYAFLIDEAHNLADRTREMYSAELRASDFSELLGLLDGADGMEFVGAAQADVLSMRVLCKDDIIKNADGSESGFYINRAPLIEFNDKMLLLKKRLGGWLARNRDHELYDAVSTLDAKVKKYLISAEYFDKGFLSYVEINNFDVRIKIFCLAPSGVMKGLLARARSSIFFSATLTPPEYFCDVLVGKEKAGTLELPSAFPPENLCVTVLDSLSVRLDDRESNFAAFAKIIAATASQQKGNYIAYFPSYFCMQKVLAVFNKRYPDVETIAQKPGMTGREREAFLQKFSSDRRLRIGFCVLGGAFAEGVDLPGSRLIGTIIFGVGLPGISNEKNIIKDYFDNHTEQGYDYAYTFPGMNNVLQAVGRVIRTEDDVGVAVLVDDRYGTPKYRALFPKHWGAVQYTGNAKSLVEILRRFWEKDKN